MNPIIFDIETGPLPLVIAHPEEWFKPDPRLKDPEKIKASIADKLDDAALSPITGQIVAIGYHDQSGTRAQVFEDEAKLIDEFWMLASNQIRAGGTMIGWNILEFDLPFLCFRSMASGITIPLSIGKTFRGRWQASEAFLDLQLLTQAGRYRSEGYSLDRVARAFGLAGKNGDGAGFHKLEREAAMAYLVNDIKITKAIAERLGY